MKKRDFNYKDVETALGVRVVGENLLRNLFELQTIQLNLTEELAYELIHGADEAMEVYLGIDPRQQIRGATKKVNELQEEALEAMGLLKKLIPVHFKNEYREMLKQLGYTRYHKDARNGDQEALMQLLSAFRIGMTDDMKASITDKGVNPEIIDRILSYGGQIWEANASQEALKGSSSEITDEAIDYLNSLYNKAMDICKIGAAFYYNNPVKRNQFTFSRIVRNMNATRTPEKDEQEPADE